MAQPVLTAEPTEMIESVGLPMCHYTLEATMKFQIYVQCTVRATDQCKRLYFVSADVKTDNTTQWQRWQARTGQNNIYTPKFSFKNFAIVFVWELCVSRQTRAHSTPIVTANKFISLHIRKKEKSYDFINSFSFYFPVRLFAIILVEIHFFSTQHQSTIGK